MMCILSFGKPRAYVAVNGIIMKVLIIAKLPVLRPLILNDCCLILPCGWLSCISTDLLLKSCFKVIFISLSIIDLLKLTFEK